MDELSSLLSSPFSEQVREEMSNQRVPRKYLSDSPALDIYKRCGWKPPLNSNEEDELQVRREFILREVSSEALECLDKISETYVRNFL